MREQSEVGDGGEVVFQEQRLGVGESEMGDDRVERFLWRRRWRLVEFFLAFVNLHCGVLLAVEDPFNHH